MPGCANIAPMLGHSREPGSLFMPGCANIGTQLGTRNLVYTKLRQYWDIVGTQSTKPIPMLQPQPNIGPMLGRIGNVTWEQCDRNPLDIPTSSRMILCET